MVRGQEDVQKARDALAAFDEWGAKGRLFELELEASGAPQEQQACGVDVAADAQEGEELEKALTRALKVS